MRIIGVHNNLLVIKIGEKRYFLEKYYIAESWVKFGGSFIKKIGEALHHADVNNSFTILMNWKNEIDLELIKKEFGKNIFRKDI